MAKCKQCGAAMEWTTMASGKKMPLDAQPISAVLVRDGIGEVVEVFRPHWGSCPGADTFRKKRGGRDAD